MTTKVLIGSTNPSKIAATKEAFEKFFDDVVVEGISVSSNVPGQPINEQTYEGAKNRALALKEHDPDASFYVGIEGGVEETNKTWFLFAGSCIIDSKGRVGFGKSPHYMMPDVMMNRILDGEELSTIMDEHVGEKDTNLKLGATGILTKGKITRKDFCVHSIMMALIPFLNEDVYFKK